MNIGSGRVPDVTAELCGAAQKSWASSYKVDAARGRAACLGVSGKAGGWASTTCASRLPRVAPVGRKAGPDLASESLSPPLTPSGIHRSESLRGAA